MAVNDNVMNLNVMMDKILNRVVGGFEANGVDLPDRRYWTFGEPAADCDQIVCSVRQLYVGPVGDEASEPQRCNSPRTAQIDIQILRKVPGPGPRGQSPTWEKLQESGRTQGIDAYTLLEIAAGLDTWDDEYTMGTGPGPGIIATVDAGEVEGDYQGPTLHLTVQIP